MANIPPKTAIRPRRRTDGRDDDAQQVIVRGPPVSNPFSHIKTDSHSNGANTDEREIYRYVTSKSEAPSRGTRLRQQKLSTACIDHRVYYRIIMDVVGIPLHHVGELSEEFRALADVVKACEIMCTAGYNHRDLSPGNIIVGTGGQGRLGDLESAKIFRSEQGGDVERTSTPDFMAVEVLQQFYLFAPPMSSDPHAVVPPFRHNAGHDLESIWWIAVFLLYNTVIGVDISHDVAEQQRDKMDRFFLQANRTTKFRSLTTALSHDFDQSPAQPAVTSFLHPMMHSLQSAYIRFEQQGDMTNNREFLVVHQVFNEKLVHISKYFEGLSGKTLAEVPKPKLSVPAHHPRKLKNGSEQDARDSEQSTKV